jgi:RNA polymerase sigma-70 factor (ECF subfamily)
MLKMKTFSNAFSLFRSEQEAVDFEEVYKQELPRIFNYFRFRVGNDQVAEDLTAETFEKAWKNRNRYEKNRAGFSTWLFSIAGNVFIDHLRKRRSEIPLDALSERSDDTKIEDIFTQQANISRLNVLLAGFAERDRELVALRYGAGLTNRTIAHLTGLSESNVAVILHRLVQKLREEWEVPHE